MTGSGIVLAAEDVEMVDRRDAEFRTELDPQTSLGKALVRQMATHSVRMERSARQETLALATRVRHAVDDFDEARLDEADRLLDVLGEEPRIHLRKLLRTPEGVERLVLAWQELRDDLTREPKPVWTAWHRERAENLKGLRIDEAKGSTFDALSNGVWGDFWALEPSGQTEAACKAWARTRLVEQIDGEIAWLEEHYETLDFDRHELDRREAPARALFDPSKEATLARRYESEASRGFFKALNELRRVEAEAAARPAVPAKPKPIETSGDLASSRDWRTPTPREPRPAAGPGHPTSEGAPDGPDHINGHPGEPPLGRF